MAKCKIPNITHGNADVAVIESDGREAHVDGLIAALMLRRARSGLHVRICHGDGTEWNGSFATEESRDDFIRRAKLNGLDPEIVAA